MDSRIPDARASHSGAADSGDAGSRAADLRAADLRAKGLLSWLLLVVGVAIGVFTTAILLVALQSDGVGEVASTLAAGGIATVASLAAFVDQRRRMRPSRAAEPDASGRRGATTATPDDDPLSR